MSDEYLAQSIPRGALCPICVVCDVTTGSGVFSNPVSFIDFDFFISDSYFTSALSSFTIVEFNHSFSAAVNHLGPCHQR